MNYILAILLTLCSFSLMEAQITSSIGSGVANFGGANNSIALQDEHAVLNNQAGMYSDSSWSFTAGLINLYGFSTLNSLYASATKKLGKYGVIGLSVKYLGDSELNEQLVGLAYCRKLTDQWTLAVQFDMLSYRSQIAGNLFVPAVELGTLVKANDALSFGFHVYNPFAKAFGVNPYSETLVRLGGQYRISDKVALLAEVQKFLVTPVAFNVGVSYEIVESLCLRTGYQIQGNQFHVGISYRGSRLSLHGATGVHNSLGLSSGAGVSYVR